MRFKTMSGAAAQTTQLQVTKEDWVHSQQQQNVFNSLLLRTTRQNSFSVGLMD